ncbi:MAG: histidine--tRNA ligase [Ruminococcaceae bacterium]|nr:histidine--tRNA ligase [Oscillospiraceae bacterium]
MIQKPRGTIDILPDKAAIWLEVENRIRKIAKRYGFGEIRLPTFEVTELYNRGVGDTSDVVQKEMYTFTDNDNRSISLRPEGTAGVVRSIIENGLCSEAMPLSLYYIISCFRYEKPQAGRSREFFQFGVEMFGADSPTADADVIMLASDIFDEFGLNVRLEINSIGCPECRPKYHAALKEYFASNIDDLCDTCKGRLEKNPLRILDCKSPICSAIAKNAPHTIDYLCDDCKNHMEGLKELLTKAGREFTVNSRIVRGLDYYRKTVFEFISEDIGAQSTVCGGGRYDGLVQSLGGPALSGIGFGMGLTRLMMVLEAQNKLPAVSDSIDIYIASLGQSAVSEGFRLSSRLRKAGFRAQCDLVGRSLKAQMKYADKKSARFVLILGDSEIENRKCMLKNMQTSEQNEVSLDDIQSIINHIK